MSQSDTLDRTDLVNDHGWPHTLCVIEVSPGRFAANVADTKGLEPDPQTDIRGLAVFASEASATDYTGALNGLHGTVVPKTFAECRQIALDRPRLVALFLMDGPTIKDVVYIR